jgi:hypothetical protein
MAHQQIIFKKALVPYCEAKFEKIPKRGFKVTAASGQEYLFERRNNLCVYPGYFYFNSRRKNALYTKRQVKDAEVVRIFRRRTGCASEADSIEILNKSGILNAQVTPPDVR